MYSPAAALQTLLRHLLTDTSGDYPWSVESMCTDKRGDYHPHVHASKRISSETVTVVRGTSQRPVEVQQDARVDLRVHAGADGTGMVVKLTLRNVQIAGNSVQDVGPVAESWNTIPHPVLDWAGALSIAARKLEDVVGTLHVASVRALHVLDADESTDDPNSGPLCTDPEQDGATG